MEVRVFSPTPITPRGYEPSGFLTVGRDIVDRTCSLAKRFADRLADSDRAEVMNEVVFNQVLVRWLSPDGDHDAFNDRVVACIQADGTAFLSGTNWGGMRLMRISVSDWATDGNDVDRAIDRVSSPACRSSTPRQSPPS